MRTTTVSRAREFAEAMLDACEIAEETRGPVAVIMIDTMGVAYATTQYSPDEADLTIYPDDFKEKSPELRVVGT